MEKTRKSQVLLLTEDELVSAPVAEFLGQFETEVSVEKSVEPPYVRKNLDDQVYDVCVIYTCRSNEWAQERLQELREFSFLPTIVTLREASKEEMVKTYRLGADDVQNSPISTELLACKIDAIVLRKYWADEPKEYHLGRLVFSVETNRIVSEKDDYICQITGRETELLALLAKNANKTVERGLILRKIWKADNYFNGRSLSVYINRLRKSLAIEDRIEIVAVHGRGYKLVIKK